MKIIYQPLSNPAMTVQVVQNNTPDGRIYFAFFKGVNFKLECCVAVFTNIKMK